MTQTRKDTRPATTKKPPQALADTELDNATGGIALLLPAVQAAREAARRPLVNEQINQQTVVLLTHGKNRS